MWAIYGSSTVILSHAMLLNATTEGFNDAYERVRAETSLLNYRHHLKITRVAKNKPCILPLKQTFKRQQILPGIHKNIPTVRILFSFQLLSDVATLGVTLHNELTEGIVTRLF